MDSLKTKGIKAVFRGNETMDGAGVRLRRIFGGHSSAVLTDPFLLLDHFGSSRREDYEMGFPWHPHRGIQTVTYLLEGKVEHEDSEGNKGTIYPDDIQWMSSGSGIYHQEMPKPLDMKDPQEMARSRGLPESMVGLQLWLNMPAKEKMSTPEYRDIRSGSIEKFKTESGAIVKVIAGKYGDLISEFRGNPLIAPRYLDVSLEIDSEFSAEIPAGHTSMIYVVSGKLRTGNSAIGFETGDCVLFEDNGSRILVKSGEKGGRFILLSGRPLKEPVYWYGPIVMNSQEQLNEAYMDLRNNRFVRDRHPILG